MAFIAAQPPSRIRLCSCGLIKQTKAGTKIQEGVTYCNACGHPTEIPIGEVTVDPTLIAAEQVTTLSFLPGFRVVKSLGVVSEIAAASGWTAGWKGSSALAEATSAMRRSAKLLGANAVIGLQSSTFGAHGGITSALGGDAVGVLLLGTAVVVEQEPEGQTEP